jgi:glycosyltransferase involved in cell wall biosynthesis
MSQSKPVLAADSKAISRILSETNSGMIYQTNNPEDFANKIFELLNSDIPFGENGYKAVKNTYNWENDKKILITMYEDLTEKIYSKNLRMAE